MQRRVLFRIGGMALASGRLLWPSAAIADHGPRRRKLGNSSGNERKHRV